MVIFRNALKLFIDVSHINLAIDMTKIRSLCAHYLEGLYVDDHCLEGHYLKGHCLEGHYMKGHCLEGHYQEGHTKTIT